MVKSCKKCATIARSALINKLICISIANLIQNVFNQINQINGLVLVECTLAISPLLQATRQLLDSEIKIYRNKVLIPLPPNV